MQRFVSRSIGLAGLFVLLSLALTGCFQPVGAALPPTATGGVGSTTIIVPTQETPLPATTEAAVVLPPTETPAPIEITPVEITPIIPTETPVTAVFPTPITPTETPVPPTLSFIGTPLTATPTETPFSIAQIPTETPFFFPTLTETPIIIPPTNTPVPPTFTPLPPTATETPTATPTATETPVPPTFTPLPPTDTPLGPTGTPTLFIPTLDPLIFPPVDSVTPETVAQFNTPEGTPVAQNTSIFPEDDTQATLNAQATQIIAIVTATAAANATLTATFAGIPGGQVTPGIGTLPPVVTLPPVFTVGPGTPTLAPGTPGTPGSGAAGPIDADCRYTVVTGDRLLRIALRFNTTPRALAARNSIVNANLISPGQVIIVPNCGLQPPSATPGGVVPPASTLQTNLPPNVTVIVVTATPQNGRVYVVQEGDTLFRIAQRFGVRMTAIAQANGIANINLIYAGQRLVIP